MNNLSNKDAGALTREVYSLTRVNGFKHDFELKRQIQAAAGSSMHNIAEGFDSGSNNEFMRFLRYAKRSCTEVQSQLYIALDQAYVSKVEFEKTYEMASETRATIHGFISYLSSYEAEKKTSQKNAPVLQP